MNEKINEFIEFFKQNIKVKASMSLQTIINSQETEDRKNGKVGWSARHSENKPLFTNNFKHI